MCTDEKDVQILILVKLAGTFDKWPVLSFIDIAGYLYGFKVWRGFASARFDSHSKSGYTDPNILHFK
jgi:hypothetical protein